MRLSKFPKTEEEEKKLEKDGDFYELKQIKVIWSEVLSCIREYFILEERSKRVHKFHFVFLNHFRHKDRISFPFYLKYSLLQSLYAHKQKDSRPILHEGMILLIENYCKNKLMATPISKKKRGTTTDSQSKKGKRDARKSVKMELMAKDTPHKNEEETSNSSDNNEDKNTETENKNGDSEEDTEMGDISSNLGGYSASKNETENNVEEESLGKNDGSRNIGNETTIQGTDGEENVEEPEGKEKELRGEEEAKGIDNPTVMKKDDPTRGLCSLSLIQLR